MSEVLGEIVSSVAVRALGVVLLAFTILFLGSKLTSKLILYFRRIISFREPHKFSREDIHENLKEVLHIVESLDKKLYEEKVTFEWKKVACFLYCLQLVAREENLSHLHYQAISQVSRSNWRISVWPSPHELGRGIIFDHGRF